MTDDRRKMLAAAMIRRIALSESKVEMFDRFLKVVIFWLYVFGLVGTVLIVAICAASSAYAVTADTQAILDGLAAVQSSVVGLALVTSSVAVNQGFDVPAAMTERTVLILLAGCFAFIVGFGMSKGYR